MSGFALLRAPHGETGRNGDRAEPAAAHIRLGPRSTPIAQVKRLDPSTNTQGPWRDFLSSCRDGCDRRGRRAGGTGRDGMITTRHMRSLGARMTDAEKSVCVWPWG